MSRTRGRYGYEPPRSGEGGEGGAGQPVRRRNRKFAINFAKSFAVIPFECRTRRRGVVATIQCIAIIIRHR